VRLPARLTRLGVCLMCTLALVAVDLTINVPESSAGPAPGLCQMNTSRGTIPANFAIEACTDAKNIYLHNNLTVALTVKASGNVGPAKRSESDYGLAADATRLNSNDPWILLPGDTVRIPIGPGAASFRVYDSPSAGFYALALTLQTFIPGSGPAVIGAFASLVSELNADFGQYEGCLASKNWLEQLGCDALLTRNVDFAFARAAVSAVATGALSAILAGVTFTKWLGAQVPNVEAVLGSGTIVIAAAPQVVPTTTTTTSTTSTTSPPATTNPTVPTAPSFATGSHFNDDCVIAWPTAPTYTNNSIEMTMSCDHVPEGQYLFTDVTYDDPSLQPTPDSGTMHVVGQVLGVARSDYGYSELEVQASDVTILGNSG
jgi:hypothetical protein